MKHCRLIIEIENGFEDIDLEGFRQRFTNPDPQAILLTSRPHGAQPMLIFQIKRGKFRLPRKEKKAYIKAYGRNSFKSLLNSSKHANTTHSPTPRSTRKGS